MDQQRGAHAHNEDAALLRDRVASIRASLVIADSHAASERIHRRVQKGEFIRLLTGIYIPSARLIGLHSRQRKTAVFVARLCALSLRYPDYVISGGVAAYLLDLPTDDQIEKLTLYAPSRECPRQIHFPAITVEKNERFSAVTTTVSRPDRQFPQSTTWASASPHRRELSLTAPAYWPTSTGSPSPARGWPTRATSTVFVRLSHVSARRRRAKSSTRHWLTLPSTPSDVSAPDGSLTALTLDASLRARPSSCSHCCARVSTA